MDPDVVDVVLLGGDRHVPAVGGQLGEGPLLLGRADRSQHLAAPVHPGQLGHPRPAAFDVDEGAVGRDARNVGIRSHHERLAGRLVPRQRIRQRPDPGVGRVPVVEDVSGGRVDRVPDVLVRRELEKLLPLPLRVNDQRVGAPFHCVRHVQNAAVGKAGRVVEVGLLVILFSGLSANIETSKCLWMFFGLAVAIQQMTVRAVSERRPTGATEPAVVAIEGVAPWALARPRE